MAMGCVKWASELATFCVTAKQLIILCVVVVHCSSVKLDGLLGFFGQARERRFLACGFVCLSNFHAVRQRENKREMAVKSLNRLLVPAVHLTCIYTVF